MNHYRLSGEDRLSYLQRLIDHQHDRNRSMAEPDSAPITPPRGTYAHVKCSVCGCPWNEHPSTCIRDSFRPAWVAWFQANPDPRREPTVARGLAQEAPSIMRDYAEAAVIVWAHKAREIGVPDQLIGKVPERTPIVNGSAH
jgi:hypothetical protein